MRSKLAAFLLIAVGLCAADDGRAQDIGANFHRVTDGVYVYLGSARNKLNADRDSNAGFIITTDGVVVVDTGNNPTDSRVIQAAIKKLTSQPVRYLLLTEPHPDHYTGSWLFSPPATIITTPLAIESMKQARMPDDAARIERMRASSPEMRTALENYQFVLPQRGYTGDKEILQVGATRIELLRMKNVHTEADTAVWLPKEKVLFSGATLVVDQFNVFRPFVSIPDTLTAITTLRALKPEYVIPAHGTAGVPGSARLFDEEEQFLKLLLERVGAMVKEGKSLEQITKELRMPEVDHWSNRDRLPFAIQAAYNTVKGIAPPAFSIGNPCHYQQPPCKP